MNGRLDSFTLPGRLQDVVGKNINLSGGVSYKILRKDLLIVL